MIFVNIGILSKVEYKYISVFFLLVALLQPHLFSWLKVLNNSNNKMPMLSSWYVQSLNMTRRNL